MQNCFRLETVYRTLSHLTNKMEKWKLTFDVQWDDDLPPKRQIFYAKDAFKYILQLAFTLDKCKSVKLIKMERLEQE